MINKIYKRIHSKYSRLFNFFFFLRYVFVIFLIAISLFLSVPKLFNYEKKEDIIKNYLSNFYDLEIINYSTIEYKILPFPNLTIKNSNLKIINKPINLKSNNINIFLNLRNIYNYENFKAKKISLEEGKISININEAKNLINYFKKLKYKFDIRNLNVNLKKNDKSIIKIKDIKFSNYGYQKYNINGEMLDKKFKASLENNNQNFNFKLLDAGIEAKFKLNNADKYSGTSKINMSNNLLRFDYRINNNQLELIKSNFRNKDVSFSLDSIVKFNPFFSIYSNININEIDKNLINNLSLEKILTNKEIIKKLNSKIKITYKGKKYFAEVIESYTSDLNLAYGRIDFTNKFLIAGNKINCKGDSILTDEFPRLNFICLIDLKNKKKFLKKFSISKKLNQDSKNITIKGSLNLFNKKVNFEKINNDKSYLANDEDLQYFKVQFENIMFDQNFFQIFKKDKIEKFLLEVI